MMNVDVYSSDAIVSRLRAQAADDELRITIHAHQEMIEEGVSLDDVTSALLAATLVENYPEHRRGSCCLVCSRSDSGRYLHVVCTTSLEVAIIITVYEPVPPKWPTPFKRGARE